MRAKYLGLDLPSPIIVSSSPYTSNVGIHVFTWIPQPFKKASSSRRAAFPSLPQPTVSMLTLCGI